MLNTSRLVFELPNSFKKWSFSTARLFIAFRHIGTDPDSGLEPAVFYNDANQPTNLIAVVLTVVAPIVADPMIVC